jgi:hypothetical protein
MMPAYPELTDKQVDAMLYYIEEKGKKTGA